ncbi:MAG: T9SS type A sorting domain-containing protein [Saprospiraceae bacterium]|nr:T9SS type A sorting domain-containing protein [Saprospiraceae bacterium]
MKFVISVIFVLYFASGALAQKHDFNWVVGFNDILPIDSIYGPAILSFDTQDGNPSLTYSSKFINNTAYFSAMISNKAGEFRYHFDGKTVQNRFHKYVGRYEDICPFSYCDGSPQMSLMLPDYLNDSSYSLFTGLWNTIGDPRPGVNEVYAYFYNLRNVLIEENSTSMRLTKNEIFLNDTTTVGMLAACKHANGRDWWILIPRFQSNQFYTILFSENKIQNIFIQNMERFTDNSGGWAFFSPDGKYYAMTTRIYDNWDDHGRVEFYHFDRCTGLLSNRQSDVFPDYSYGRGSGGCFSPNSKYLYTTIDDFVYQYSILDGKMGNRQIIGTTDGVISHVTDSFHLEAKMGEMLAGPDGKIYIHFAMRPSRFYHTIEKPNLAPEKSDFNLRKIRLFTVIWSMPLFPHFRLGPIDGSDCDTLGIDNVPWAWWRYDQDTARYRCFEFVDLSGYLTEESEPEWYWDLGDGTQSRDTSPIHCFEKDGIYEVCLIVNNKYGADTLCRTLNVGTSATNDEGKIEIKTDIFPNPASDHFVLNVHDYLPESMYLHLINSQGQTVLRERVFQGSNVIDTELLPTGIFLVNLFERGVLLKSEKIVVVK